MLAAVGDFPGPIDGIMGQQATDAVKSFQIQKGLTSDGVMGPKTRKALYRAYMDEVAGVRLQLDKEKNFLARNKNSDGKGDYQGCGEFNAIRMFSQEENTAFQKAPDKAERNNENAPNRRVMVLLFAPGRRLNPQRWPCPTIKEGTAGCKKRFFADAETRRSFQTERREFKETKNTFACRFYQIISDDSPCESFAAVRDLRWVSLRFEGAGVALEQILQNGRDQQIRRMEQPSANGSDETKRNRHEHNLTDLLDNQQYSTHVMTASRLVSTRVTFRPAALHRAFQTNDPAAISAAIRSMP